MTKKMKKSYVPLRYLPYKLTKRDRKKQVNMLEKSRKMYKKGKYYTRKSITSYKNKTSNHILKAKQIYNLDTISPTSNLAKATGCSIDSLRKIVQKGEGAYFSSGSRPNQTAQSWGLARLASSVTGGKAAAGDFDILEKGCKHNKKAFLLAKQSRKQYNYGHSRTKRVRI
jgi:hypothetical protein